MKVPNPLNFREGESPDGLVDELAIFSIALGADDINVIMSKGLQGAAPVSQAGKLAATWSSIKNH